MGVEKLYPLITFFRRDSDFVIFLHDSSKLIINLSSNHFDFLLHFIHTSQYLSDTTYQSVFLACHQFETGIQGNFVFHNEAAGSFLDASFFKFRLLLNMGNEKIFLLQ